ncbi:hypothetical protein G9A89_015858 [Geosiphon pyriformis]|nr:hypothetical protein G9A89_015858 [Geosiphon pyriformis]
MWDLRNSYYALLYTLPMNTTAHNLSDLVQSYACCAVVCFDTEVARKAAIHSTLVFKGVNFIWAGLFSSKCVTYSNFGHISSGCGSGKKNFGPGFKNKRFFCSDSDKRHLVLIYAKIQAFVSYLISFSGATWAFVVSGSPKNLYSTPLVENNSSIGSVDSLMPVVMILALHISVFKHSLKNMSNQIADISHKLDRLLVVSSASFTVPSISKHNPKLDMAVNALLFVFFMLSVITTISQDISPSGSHVLTAKIGGLETNLAVLENSYDNSFLSPMNSLAWKIATCNVKGINHMVLNNDISIVTETKLRSSIKSWIVNKFPGIRVFTSGLDAGFLSMGVALIMNENLAKHVSKISEILDRLLMVHLLFKNKQSVSVLCLYVKTSLNKHIIQAGLVNFFIVRACNKSTFVILSGNFNEDKNKCSSSFSKCVDLGLVNTLVNSSYIKTSTWKNSRSVERTIDYIFVLQSLSNVLVNGCVVDVDEFFSIDYSSVQITIGLGEILDPVLRAIHVQANKDRLELLVSKLVKTSCSVSSNEFVFLLDVWVSLNSINASTIKSFFLGSYFDAIRLALAKIKKSYCFLKIMESKYARDFQIRLAIDKKMENFELNKDQTIKSVLEQPFYKVTLNHLVVNEDLILEPNLIKFYVNRIIKGWTRKYVVVDDISNEWYHQFQLLEYVFNDAFSNVIHSIKVEEFFGVVLSLPNNKAASLSGITNEL